MPDEEQKQDPAPDSAQSQDDQALKDLLNDLSNEPPEEEPEETPDPKQLEPIVAQPTPITTMEQQQITEFAKKFGEVSNEILSNYKADRDQINDTIEYLENLVFNATGQRVHVEMLVAALRTKAETNASAVKLLDSLAKFLAATKGTNVFVQNNNTTIQDDLKQILAKAPYLDEIKNAKN
jgi:hypothetical protein